MTGIPASLALTDRSAAASVPSRAIDALAILLVWLGSALLAVFVAPQPPDASTSELLYYSVYNVAVGSLVGFYLFDRVPRDGHALFLLRGSSAILCGTLVNEALVEPLAFASAPINGQGLYYGLTDALSTAGLFLFLRLAERLHALQQRDVAEPAGAADGCFFVRVANGTRRIYAPDVLYMRAERDFTRIVCAGGEHFVSENLKNVIAKSAQFGLVRIHKSFAVNLRWVERATRTEVQLGERRLPVGRRYWPAFAESWRSLD